MVESAAGDWNHNPRAAYAVGSDGSLHRSSDCGITRSGDFDLRSWDYHNSIQAQTIALGCSLVSRGLLERARMVAHSKALERWQLAIRR